jgi:hypothetical protein
MFSWITLQLHQKSKPATNHPFVEINNLENATDLAGTILNKLIKKKA